MVIENEIQNAVKEPDRSLVVESNPVDVTCRFVVASEERKRRMRDLKDFVKNEMIEGEDFGTVPGVQKPFLMKAGAEKLNNFTALFPEYKIIKETRDFENGFFDYQIHCSLIHVSIIDGVKHRIKVSESFGSCNSMESKYRYRWVWRSQVPEGVDLSTLETKKVGRNQDKTMYKILNVEPYDLDNTILKMSQKRAYVGATLSAQRASGLFTQDVGDDDKKPTNKPEDKPKSYSKGKPVQETSESSGEQELEADRAERRKALDDIAKLKEKLGDDVCRAVSIDLFGSRTTLNTEEFKTLAQALKKADIERIGEEHGDSEDYQLGF